MFLIHSFCQNTIQRNFKFKKKSAFIHNKPYSINQLPMMMMVCEHPLDFYSELLTAWSMVGRGILAWQEGVRH